MKNCVFLVCSAVREQLQEKIWACDWTQIRQSMGWYRIYSKQLNCMCPNWLMRQSKASLSLIGMVMDNVKSKSLFLSYLL